MKDINIKIHDEQVYEDHSDERDSEFIGQLAFKNDSIYITYKDIEQGVTTIIKAKGRAVSVKRIGNVRGNLEFSPGYSHKTIYHTPYGEMEMEVITEQCEVYLLEKGVKVYISYKILMQGQKISDNIYMIVAN